MRRSTGPAILLLALTLAVGACGDGGDEEERVQAVVEEFVEAGNAREFDRFCELLTADARDGLEQYGEVVAEGEEAGCEEVLAAQAGDQPGEAEVEVEEVQIEGERADVHVTVTSPNRDPGEQTLELEREGDEWRVAQFAEEH